MKKTIVLFLLTLAIVPFLVKGERVKADTISSLSYAKGVNLIDKSNLSYDDYLSNIHPIYIKDTTKYLYLQIPKVMEGEVDKYCGAIQVIIYFYDIDGNELGTRGNEDFMNECSEDTVNGVTYYDCEYMILNKSFSFSFIISGIKSALVTDGYPNFIMALSDNVVAFEEFIKADGIFDLSSGDIPTLTVAYPRELTEAEVRSLVSAYDGYSGDLSSSMTVDLSAYLASKKIVGKYQVNCSVSDSEGNSSSGHFFISVIDNVAPVIIGKEVYKCPVNQTVTKEMILSSYSASDEYDGDLNTGLTITSEFPASSSTISTTPVVLSVSDSSGNTTTKTITLSFYDNTAPVFNDVTTVILSYQVNKKIADIVSESIKVTDNLDLNPTIIIKSDAYTGHETRLGTYQVVFEATDSSGNKSSKTISITVEDKIKPVIVFNAYTIETLSSVSLDLKDMSNILYSSGVLVRSKRYKATVLKDTYTPNFSIPGSYVFIVRYSTDDQDFTKEFMINVTGNSYSIDLEAKKIPPLSTLEIIMISLSGAVLTTGGALFLVHILKKRKKALKY